MRWVIKNKKNGLYVVSKKVLSILTEQFCVGDLLCFHDNFSLDK